LSAWSFTGSKEVFAKCLSSLLLPSLMAFSATSIPVSKLIISLSTFRSSLFSWISLYLLDLTSSFAFNSWTYLLLLDFTDSNNGLVIEKLNILPTCKILCLTLLSAMIISSLNEVPWKSINALLIEKTYSSPAFPREKVNIDFTKAASFFAIWQPLYSCLTYFFDIVFL